MKKLILLAVTAILFASCGPSPKRGDINVLGRWYTYEDDDHTIVDSTAYVEFFDDMTYVRRYHDAARAEEGTYAVNSNTKEKYDAPAKRVILTTNESQEKYFMDIVKDKEKEEYVFVITYEINEKEDILYFEKDKRQTAEK